MKSVNWWLIRHAPVLDSVGRINGWNNSNADISGTHPCPLLPKNPKAVVVSHLIRTSQTANALGYVPSHVERDLAEQNFGDWQGKRWDEISEFESRAFWADFANSLPPGGESFADMRTRAAKAIERISLEIGEGDVLAVLHGGTIRAAIAHALSLDATRAQAFVIDNLSLTRLDRTDQGWRIGSVNERLFA